MWKEIWKKYGKLVAAAVFLTVAGLCYGVTGGHTAGEMVRLPDVEAITEQESLLQEETAQEYTIEAVTVSRCFVHICGEVVRPGVYELPEGSRVFEAVEMAGGFTEGAAQSSLNLAGMVSDGMQIVILSKEEAAARMAEEHVDDGLVNINKASKEQLMTLPGIGASRAEEIIRYREQSGGFQTIEDIMKVSGIKDAAFQKIKDSITV